MSAENSLDLRARTSARVGLERTGVSVATRPALEFLLAHAQARDAVHAALSVAPMMAALRERGLEALAVKSAVSDRAEYLRRPDLGRRLAAESAEMLAVRAGEARAGTHGGAGRSVMSIIFADGLSALAVERHALPVMDALLARLRATGREQASDSSESGWVLAPVVVAEQGRVALGDEIGARLRADVSVILIGERPGLSAPDSLGAYITWGPRVGRMDAERNCVSNIRAEGLDYAAAAERILWYASEGRRLGLTGVALRTGATLTGSGD